MYISYYILHVHFHVRYYMYISCYMLQITFAPAISAADSDKSATIDTVSKAVHQVIHCIGAVHI